VAGEETIADSSKAVDADQAFGEPLSLAHRAELEPLLQARWGDGDPVERTLSDPWFANLYLFRAVHDWRVLRAGAVPRTEPSDRVAAGQPVGLSGRAYDGTRLLLPLIDLAGADDATLRGLLRHHDAFGPLSADQAARLDPSRFQAKSHRDDADYLYPADHFRHYRGTLLNKKRNLVKQLLAAHRVEAVPYSKVLAAEALPVLQGWMVAKGKRPGEADGEPCREALSLADALGFDGCLHRVDGEAAGFVLAQAIRPGVAVVRFAKAADRFKGLAQHMFQHYALAHPALRWLNFEQDLGLPNFRRTKLSYQPSALLEKFRVTLHR